MKRLILPVGLALALLPASVLAVDWNEVLLGDTVRKTEWVDSTKGKSGEVFDVECELWRLIYISETEQAQTCDQWAMFTYR